MNDTGFIGEATEDMITAGVCAAVEIWGTAPRMPRPDEVRRGIKHIYEIMEAERRLRKRP